MRKTIQQLKHLRESEDKVEFKKAEGGNFSYNGGSRIDPKERRRCILGYIIALCNEGGGSLVLGMHNDYPHQVVGTNQNLNSIGDLEANIYNDTGIRSDVYELYEDGKRILVIDVPPRPIGQVFKFEDVPLMRVGEELKPMDDKVYLSIIQEQEGDFSQQICSGLTTSDLDETAIEIMKIKYSEKQKNPNFRTLNTEQVLSDLNLLVGGNLTNAALILLGKEEVIKRRLPQAAVRLEYRVSESQIHFDNRVEFQQPFFIMIDNLWEVINQRNGSIPVIDGAYSSFEIPLFNREVIREAINNAVAHRDYSRQSETVIKQYPQKMEIVNGGGFPLGVSLENLLTTPSTPRNRLLADVLSKTGLVERSGQGVDKIFLKTISEGKPEPDYSKSDSFCVSLTLSAEIEDKAFALFINHIQESLTEDKKLSVFEIGTLNNIRKGAKKETLDKQIIEKLKERNLIEITGKTRAQQYILCKDYYEFADKKVEYSKKVDWNTDQAKSMVLIYLTNHTHAKMGDFVKLFDGGLSRKQTRYLIDKMVESGTLSSFGTTYTLSDKHKADIEIIDQAMKLGFEELKKRGIIENTQDNDF